MSELKGCPFCGGAAKTYYNYQTRFWFIQCGKCKLKFEFAFHDETEAAENWNMRADESAIDKAGRFEKMELCPNCGHSLDPYWAERAEFEQRRKDELKDWGKEK